MSSVHPRFAAASACRWFLKRDRQAAPGAVVALAACIGSASGCSAEGTPNHAAGGSHAAVTTLATGGAAIGSGGARTAETGGAATGGTSNTGSSAAGGSRAEVTGGTSAANGGSKAAGGTNSSATSVAVGGRQGIGGSAATAGTRTVGGSIAAGGTKATGGSLYAGGGAQSVGGASIATGGSRAGGGTKATGGSSAAAGGSSGGLGTLDGGTEQTLVENESADCQVASLPDASALPKITKLPDPFTKLDGTRVSSKPEWHCRRQEIRKQAEKYIFGEKPAAEIVSGTVTNTKISVHVEALGKKIDFSADVVLPTKGQAPFPAIINVGAKGGMGGMTIGESRVLDQGVAVIYYNNYDLGIEGTPEQSRGKPNAGKFYDIYGGTHSAGLLMAWAWGASRMLDVLQKSGGSIIDLSGVGVTGCSRMGKGAFTIGVFDDRIALTIPQEPSTGGDPAYRIMDKLSGAERTDYNYNGLNWLSNNFAPFVFSNNTSNAVKLPIDTHALIAAMAPRGVLILENPHQTQMGAPAGHMATVGGLEVFKALGFGKNVSYHSSVADTAHCSYKNEYTDLLIKSITSFLKHAGDAPGQVLAGSGGTVSQSDWIDWKAPTLQ